MQNNKRSFVTDIAVFIAIVITAVLLTVSCAAMSDWAVSEIETAREEHLVPEYPEDIDWEAPATRADTVESIVKLIEKLSGKKITKYLRNRGINRINLRTFKDCDTRNVLYCNALGIINGVKKKEFRPDESLTRAQLAAIINRVAALFGVRTDVYSHNFKDMDGHWASGELGWQYRAGVMKGTSESTFDPDTPVTYEQLTAIMLRLYNAVGKEDGGVTYYEDEFYVTEITDGIFARINGKSYRENEYIKREDLRYVHLLNKDADGNISAGEMICNKLIADDVRDIMLELYKADYPIERVRLVDEYNSDDEESMEHNNTSCFNYRPITNSVNISYHALGLAVDVNPLYNPYIHKGDDGTVILPIGGEKYADDREESDSPYVMKDDDLCVKLFCEKGFEWGGEWDVPIDYQHFEMNKYDK